MAKYGRDDLTQIATMLPSKSMEEVTKYHATFWSRGKSELKKFDHWIGKIKRQEDSKKKEEENKIKKNAVQTAFNWKMNSYPLFQSDFLIKNVRYIHYTKEHNYFILDALRKYGIENPDAYHMIHREIM